MEHHNWHRVHCFDLFDLHCVPTTRGVFVYVVCLVCLFVLLAVYCIVFSHSFVLDIYFFAVDSDLSLRFSDYVHDAKNSTTYSTSRTGSKHRRTARQQWTENRPNSSRMARGTTQTTPICSCFCPWFRFTH